MSARWERVWYPEEPEALPRKAALAPLAALELGFAAAVRARNALYASGVLKSHDVPGARVISVGNLTLGGSGKTPAVVYLARRLTERGRRVAVLTRGYGRASRGDIVLVPGAARPGASVAGDEPLLIAASCPGVAVLVGADRIRLGKRAVREHGAEVLLLDDGLQHRRLKRDVDIAVVDTEVGFGNGHLFPRGPLREPVAALNRASLLWVRGTGPIPATWRGPTVRAIYQPTELVSADGQIHPASALHGQRVLALAGIARPGRFRATLAALGADVVETRFFADHHLFTWAEFREALQRARSMDARIVTTEKDAMRLPPDAGIAVLRLGVRLLEGADALDRVLRI